MEKQDNGGFKLVRKLEADLENARGDIRKLQRTVEKAKLDIIRLYERRDVTEREIL